MVAFRTFDGRTPVVAGPPAAPPPVAVVGASALRAGSVALAGPSGGGRGLPRVRRLAGEAIIDSAAESPFRAYWIGFSARTNRKRAES